MRKINKIGMKFGRLTVIADMGSRVMSGRKRIYFRCHCECGNIAEIETNGLNRTKSCGCLNSEMIGALNLKHGEANKTKENRAWFGMKDRCYNENAIKFPQYGGRGIYVCNRWLLSYEDFLSDMGRAPSKYHSIDRINVNGNYEPSNCQWADPKQQANNTTRNIYLSLNGVTLTMRQWSDKLGYNYKSFHGMLRYQNKTLEELAVGKL